MTVLIHERQAGDRSHNSQEQEHREDEFEDIFSDVCCRPLGELVVVVVLVVILVIFTHVACLYRLWKENDYLVKIYNYS